MPGLDGFLLGGGTSLALRFGHRLSVDLDFFTLRAFEPEEMAANPAISGAVQVGRGPNSLSLAVDGVKVDFLRHAYPLMGEAELVEGVPLLSVADVAAMKLNAVANRGAKKDFFDVHELSRHFPLREMIGFFGRKYANVDRFTVIRSLVWFEDAESDPDPVSLTGASWEDVKTHLRTAVAALD